MYSNDSDLIKKCLAGEESAWRNLVDRYARLVYSVALAHGLRVQEAEDVFHQIFMLTFRQLQNLREHRFIAGWLISMTHRECQQLHHPAFPDSNAFSADDIQVWERRHLIGQAIQQLESPCREILQALFRDPPMNPITIADQLGIPSSSIGTLRARCFKKLETILASMGADLA